MNLEELKCDILDVLQNEDNINALYGKCMLSCREFQSSVAVKIEAKLLYEKGMIFYILLLNYQRFYHTSILCVFRL